MPNGRFGMQPVDVEHINAAGLELAEGVIEAGADEGGKRRVVRAIVLENLGEGRFVIAAGLLIAAPGIDAEAAGASLVLSGGLAKGKITFAAIDPQFDDQRRAQRRDKVVS